MIGQTVSHYKVLARLGEGGMGVVYKAEDTRLGRAVALKFLSHPELDNGENRERFLREARAEAALNHPNICTVYEVDEYRGQPFIAMELVEGGTLDSRISSGSISVPEAMGYVLEIADGMREAHAKGIIHRDIKPGNILLTEKGRIKITDFGLARLVQDTQLTRTGTTMGTLSYISPEQLHGQPVDHRCDLWALGIVLYELLTGKLPFQGDNDAALLYAIAHEEPIPLDPGLVEGDRDLGELLSRLLAKDPDERISDMDSLVAILHGFSDQETRALPQQPVTPRGVTGGYTLRKAMIASITSLALLLVIWQVFFTPENALSFAERDWILLSDVDNRTGDEAFDLALKAALEADLQQSRYVNVYDRNQVIRTLNFMRCNPDTFIGEVVGRDICRYAGIKGLLQPRILKIDDVYELYATLIDPITGRHVERIRVTVRGRENVLLEAIDELCAELRNRLGESLAAIKMHDVRVVETTTSSWEALRLFAVGYEKWGERRLEEAAHLFQRAIEEDPDYVLAKGALGMLKIQFLEDVEGGKALLDEAFRSSDSVSERERIMIRAAHRDYVLADPEGAFREYEVITSLYPDMAEPYNNRGIYLQSVGRYEEAVIQFEKAAEMDRFFAIPMMNLYWTYITWLADPVRAEAVAERIVALDPTEPNYLFTHAWTVVAQMRFEEGESLMREIVALEPNHHYARPNLAHLLLRRGAAAEALPTYRDIYLEASKVSDPTWGVVTGEQYAIALNLSGDHAGAQRELAAMETRFLAGDSTFLDLNYSLIQLAQLKVLQGRESAAQDLLERVLSRETQSVADLFAISALYASMGNAELSIHYLKEAMTVGFLDRYYCLIHPCFHKIKDDPEFLNLITGPRITP